MVDKEKELLSLLDAGIPEASVSSGDQGNPEEFPALILTEGDNYSYTRTMDSGSYDNHCVLVYFIDAYSDDPKNKKELCKSLISKADEIIQGEGFVRTMCAPVPNLSAPEIYRIRARYEGVVEASRKIVFRR